MSRSSTLREMAEITIDQLSDIVAAVEHFKHTGFDAVVVYNRLKRLGGQDFKKDMTELMVLVKLRGTSMLKPGSSSANKWASKTGEAGKARLQALVQKYKIVAKQTTADQVTLPQIVATFPNITAQILASTDFVEQVPLGELHPFYAFPHAPAIIPSEDTTQLEAWKSWANSFDALINSKKTGHKSRVDEFFPIIHGSKVFNDEARQTLLEKLEEMISNRP
jgi:hypothetical protein